MQPEQETLAFTPVQTIFSMDEFFIQQDEETHGSELTQLLAWMKRSEQRQAEAEQKEREWDETLRKIWEEQRAQARKLEDLTRRKPVTNTDAEKKKAEVDKAREDELTEMMASHRMFYEEAGLEVPEALLVSTSSRNLYQRSE
jgi:flagellar biosynthesis component FlhA